MVEAHRAVRPRSNIPQLDSVVVTTCAATCTANHVTQVWILGHNCTTGCGLLRSSSGRNHLRGKAHTVRPPYHNGLYHKHILCLLQLLLPIIEGHSANSSNIPQLDGVVVITCTAMTAHSPVMRRKLHHEYIPCLPQLQLLLLLLIIGRKCAIGCGLLLRSPCLRHQYVPQSGGC